MPARARILISIAVTLAVFIAAAVTITLRPVTYSAQAEIAIVPRVTDETAPIQAADTISRGTVVDTYAQVYGTQRTRDEAVAAYDGPAVDATDVQVSAIAVAGTSIVRITAVADNAATAELVADAIATYETNLGGFSRAFRTQVIEAAAGSGAISGPSRSLLYVAGAIAALALGGLTFLALGRISRPEQPAPAPKRARPQQAAQGPTPNPRGRTAKQATQAQASAPTARPPGTAPTR